MIDLHSHILYGTDDGARDYEESVAMLKQAAKLGYKKIVATSHYPSCDETERQKAYGVLKNKAKSYGIELYPGREIMITPETLKRIVAEDGKVTEGRRYLLIEFQIGTVAEAGKVAVKRVVEAGYLPVVAHVERYGWSTEDLMKLKKDGAVLQMNIRAAAKGKNLWKKWLRCRMIDILATDSHRSQGRSYELEEEVDLLRDTLGGAEFERLTTINPEKVIVGEEILIREADIEELKEIPEKKGILKRFLGGFRGGKSEG